MKKICLAILSMAFIAVAVAQEPVSPKPRFSGFVSNGLWDNWEISAGVGVGTAFSTGTNIGPKKNALVLKGIFGSKVVPSRIWCKNSVARRQV